VIDVSCFVEIMNRTDRMRQQAYVVRIVPMESSTAASKTAHEDESPYYSQKSGKAFIRLRIGRDLAPIMRIGLKWKSNLTTNGTPNEQLVEVDTPERSRASHKLGLHRSVSAPLDPQREPATIADILNMTVHSFEEAKTYRDDDGNAGSSDEEWDAESVDEIGSVDRTADVDVQHLHPSSSKRSRRSRNLIGKIARSVKTKTSAAARTTTKKVDSRSLKVGVQEKLR
jgi:hypothetical protein